MVVLGCVALVSILEASHSEKIVAQQILFNVVIVG